MISFDFNYPKGRGSAEARYLLQKRKRKSVHFYFADK